MVETKWPVVQANANPITLQPGQYCEMVTLVITKANLNADLSFPPGKHSKINYNTNNRDFKLAKSPATVPVQFRCDLFI